MGKMTKRLLSLLPLVALFLSIAAFVSPQSVSAANEPSNDGLNHLKVALSGTSDPSKYSLSGSHTVSGKKQTVKFSYKSGDKAFLSDGMPGTEETVPMAIRLRNS